MTIRSDLDSSSDLPPKKRTTLHLKHSKTATSSLESDTVPSPHQHPHSISSHTEQSLPSSPQPSSSNIADSSDWDDSQDFFPTSEQFERLVFQHAALHHPRKDAYTQLLAQQRKDAKTMRRTDQPEQHDVQHSSKERTLDTQHFPEELSNANHVRTKKTNFYRARARAAKYSSKPLRPI